MLGRARLIRSLLLGVPPLITGGEARIPFSVSGPDVLAALPHAIVLVDDDRRELVIELSAVDVPAAPARGTAMVHLPVSQAPLPISGAICKYYVEIVDSAGRELPKSLLHHFNLTDPARRELFLTTALHVLAASRETPPG